MAVKTVTNLFEQVGFLPPKKLPNPYYDINIVNPLSASCSCDAKIGAKNTEKNSTGT
jgi:hypothetical protein